MIRAKAGNAIFFGLAITLCVAGVTAHLTPAPQLSYSFGEHTKLRPNTQSKGTDFSEFAHLFDQGVLPEEIKPTPPTVQKPDPFASLKRYRLSAVIESKSKSIIILSKGSEGVTKSVGDVFQGATLTGISQSSAIFKIEDEVYEMVLEPDPSDRMAQSG
ncbi:MAG: hypothetical protein AAGJ73_14585 [Pseudomonadota bacterium]